MIKKALKILLSLVLSVSLIVAVFGSLILVMEIPILGTLLGVLSGCFMIAFFTAAIYDLFGG